MKALLIYQHIPEMTHFYLLPAEVHERYKTALEGSHGKIGNSVENPWTDDMALIMDATMSDEYAKDRTFDVSFSAYKVNEEKPFVLDANTVVYVTGMFM